MRHRVKGYKLNRTASHRVATLRSLATALFKHKRIKTTVTKAKAARMFVEPLISKAKNDSVSSRRLIARHIQDREVLKELFGTIVEKIGDRPGGYTRIVKLGNRLGDAAEMAILELVDFNDAAPAKKSSKPKASKKAPKEKVVEDAQVVEETVETEVESAEETPVVENEESAEVEAAAEETAEEVTDVKAEDVKEETEEKKEDKK